MEEHKEAVSRALGKEGSGCSLNCENEAEFPQSALFQARKAECQREPLSWHGRFLKHGAGLRGCAELGPWETGSSLSTFSWVLCIALLFVRLRYNSCAIRFSLCCLI